MEIPEINFDFSEPLPERKESKKSLGQKGTSASKHNSNIANKSPRGRKSLKSFTIEAGLISIPDDDVLFKKAYYSIGDVAEMFKLKTSLIRFWENEFDILEPKKNTRGDRHFRPEDVKSLRLIYHLLRERKYTIEGAKDFLKSNKNALRKFEVISSLQKLRSFLFELKSGL